jgi:hypothetical protein
MNVSSAEAGLSTDRDIEKKKRELIPCRLLAEEINREQGTDYKACESDEGLADALLRSVSGKYLEIAVQVVSVPLDWRHRDDNQGVAKMNKVLTDALARRGAKHCSIDLALSRTATRRMPGIVVERLADLICGEAEKGSRQLGPSQIAAYSPELTQYVDCISIFYSSAIQAVTVSAPSGDMLPPDGRWIEEGISIKVAKYGGPAAVSALTLVIDVAGVVDDGQISAFKAAHDETMLPFSEIWILGLRGIVCLKRKTS